MILQDAVRKLASGADLTRDEASGAMQEIMSGEAPDGLVGGFLVGLRAKGETGREIAGCAEVLRRNAIRIATRHAYVVDTCGTGGDGSGTFNISTTSALIACGAGVPVAKHGNRAVSSSCGSADVLAALGVRIDLSPEKVTAVLDDVGITFLFAPLMHGAMKHVAKVRRELGTRTIFNILGPLANPAGSKRQVLGVFDRNLGKTMSEALLEMGSEHALVVHGSDGLDEFTVGGKSSVWELFRGEIRHYDVNALDLGLKERERSLLAGGDAATNAEIVKGILSGKDGAPRDVSLLNAAAAILVSGKAKSLAEALPIARESVDSGRATLKLNQWIEASNS